MIEYLFAQCALIIFIYMTGLFIIAQIKRDNSIVDIGWGIGFIIIALFTLFKNGLFLQRHLFITMLTIVWGMRLATHIYIRNRGRGEGPRYKRWRQNWKTFFYLRSYLQIFILQGALMLIIASPIIAVNASTVPGMTFLDLLGFVTWFVGFFFESVADYQLFVFLAKPENRGKILKEGLWFYTRHPNYFGEVLIWWGMYLIALNVPYGYSTFISPLTITYLLLFISGIPLAEKPLEEIQEFQDYKKKTSIFIPWFIRK